MNTYTIVLNRSNVVAGTNNTKYVYRFPQTMVFKDHEIAVASLQIYYSWANIQLFYNNHVFSYLWWNHQGILNQRNDIIIPDGFYSISTLSDFIHSQMLLRGHYVVDTITQKKIYFITFFENATYYATEFEFRSMYAKNTPDAGTNYINENPPTQVYDTNGNLVWKGWDWPASKQYPQVIFDNNSNIKRFLGFQVGNFPANGTPISTTFDLLSQGVPEVHPVSGINITSNFCRSEISIPDNILFNFSQGTSSYGDLIIKEPANLIWMRIPEGGYNVLEIQFIDQDFNQMKILDNQLIITLLIREI